MDPSLVIKGVDENIKIFCSLVVFFFSLSLSVENGWQKESTDSQGSSKLQNEGKTRPANTVEKHFARAAHSTRSL